MNYNNNNFIDKVVLEWIKSLNSWSFPFTSYNILSLSQYYQINNLTNYKKFSNNSMIITKKSGLKYNSYISLPISLERVELDNNSNNNNNEYILDKNSIMGDIYIIGKVVDKDDNNQYNKDKIKIELSNKKLYNDNNKTNLSILNNNIVNIEDVYIYDNNDNINNINFPCIGSIILVNSNKNNDSYLLCRLGIIITMIFN
jgi:hypothetical protein